MYLGVDHEFSCFISAIPLGYKRVNRSSNPQEQEVTIYLWQCCMVAMANQDERERIAPTEQNRLTKKLLCWFMEKHCRMLAMTAFVNLRRTVILSYSIPWHAPAKWYHICSNRPLCLCPSQGGGRKKIPGTGVQLFFRGVPPEGEGGTKKNSRKNFFRTPKSEISLSLPHVFGFGRCKEGIFQSNHAYFSRYGWCLCLRAQRPPVCSGCNAAPHPGLLSAGKSPQIRQYTLSGARNRTSSIEGQR